MNSIRGGLIQSVLIKELGPSPDELVVSIKQKQLKENKIK